MTVVNIKLKSPIAKMSYVLSLKICYLKIQYHFDKVVCKFLKVTINVYFHQVQTPSIQDGRLRAYMEYFS